MKKKFLKIWCDNTNGMIQSIIANENYKRIIIKLKKHFTKPGRFGSYTDLKSLEILFQNQTIAVKFLDMFNFSNSFLQYLSFSGLVGIFHPPLAKPGIKKVDYGIHKTADSL